ncbi:DUF6137 domain-containing protein [Kitasatospora purpeofusca]|uniref:DUF6137 domain-containing protein n=1 Tax=Kitasatospora purpeofusca TaxID=67352 RepID=UPI0037F2AB81
MTRLLVVKCLSDETGDDPGEIAEAGYLEVNAREFVKIVNRLESYFDCSLDLLGAPADRFDVDGLVARLALRTAGAGRA